MLEEEVSGLASCAWLAEGNEGGVLGEAVNETRMESTPLTLGRQEMKSSETESQGPLGTGRGSRRLVGEQRSVFLSWQDLHVWTNCSTSKRKAGEVK